MSLLLKLAVAVLCVYALIGLAAYLGQRRLMYFPDRARTLPAQVGLADVEERVLKTPDGARIVAWYGKAKPGRADPPLFPRQRRRPRRSRPAHRALHGPGLGRLHDDLSRLWRQHRQPDGDRQRRRRAPRLRRAGARGRGADLDHPLREVAGLRRRRAARHRAAGRRRGARCALHLDRGRRRAGLSVPAGAPAARRPLRDRPSTSPRCGCRC